MIWPRPTQNLGITREMGVTVALVASVTALLIIVMAVLLFGIDDNSTPIIVSIAGTFAFTMNSLISALKSTESADASSKAKNASELSASKTAVLQQALADHLGHICPREDCPFKPDGGTS